MCYKQIKTGYLLKSCLFNKNMQFAEIFKAYHIYTKNKQCRKKCRYVINKICLSHNDNKR